MPSTLNPQPSTSLDAFTVSVDSVTEPEWNSLLPRFADANFYQTWAYGAVSWGEQQLSHLILRQREDSPNQESSPLPSLPMNLGSGTPTLVGSPSDTPAPLPAEAGDPVQGVNARILRGVLSPSDGERVAVRPGEGQTFQPVRSPSVSPSLRPSEERAGQRRSAGAEFLSSSPLPSLSSPSEGEERVAEGRERSGRRGTITGQDIVAAAQLRIVKLPLVRAGVAYLRWGPLCRRSSEPEDNTLLRPMLAALIAEYVERRGLLLRIVPALFAGDPAAERLLDCLREFGFQREDQPAPYRTIRVDLTAAPDIIRKRLDGKWRNQLNAAERNGLTVTEGTGDELYGQFLALYDEMMARKQFETTVDAHAFRGLQQRQPESQRMLIMISSKDGVPQTGLVSTTVGETGIYLLGATSNDGMKSKGSYLLQWRMMNRLKERGCHWYDLGGINPVQNPGVYHFKQGMGGEEVTGLGRYELRGNRLSSVAVNAAERLKSLVARIKK